MRLCFSTLACPSWSLNQIIATANLNDIGGVDLRGIQSEIDITRLPEFNEDLDETLALLRASEVEFPCFNTSVTLLAPPDRWEQMLDESYRYAAIAMQTGTRYLRIFGGAIPKELTRGQATLMAQRRLRQLVKICHGRHCHPLVETHDDWSASQSLLELLHEFMPGEAGVLWDIEHPCRCGEDPAETATALRRYIHHVHVKDSIRNNGKNIQKLLGEGDLPIAEVVRTLREQQYAGWYCLETEKRWQAEAPDPEISVPHFVHYMRELSREPASSIRKV